MTPLTFMPAAPPSRPVAPAGGGVADTPSSSSFESALQRAGAADDDPRPAASRPESKPRARQAAGTPATQSTAAARKPPSDTTSAGKGDEASADAAGGDATDCKPARMRVSSANDAAATPESKDAPKESPEEPRAAPVVVPIVAAADEIPPAAGAPTKVDVVNDVTRPREPGMPEQLGALSAKAAPKTLESGATKRDPSVASPKVLGDLAAPGDTHAEPSSDQPPVVSTAHATASPAAMRWSSQAARTLLADALQRATAPNAQATLSTADARPVTGPPAEAVAQAAVALKAPSAAQAATENAPVAKVQGKVQTALPAAQDFGLPADGPAQHEGTGAGNGEPSTGSGRRENAPAAPQPKADGPISWPTAFAVRVPEAMTSSLERTGSAPAMLPSPVTQQDLSNVGPQLVRGFQLQAHAGGGDVKMTLNPEHLGSVTIEVQVRHDRVSATLTAETPEVRQWIALHQADLKNSLAGVGLTLADLVVKDEGGGGRQDARGDQQQSQSRRRHPAPEQSEGQFEVVV